MPSLSQRDSRHLLAFVAAPVFELLAVVFVSAFAAIPIERFTRDPADLAVQHPLWGVVSNLGILLWCTSATVCAFGSHALARREQRVTEGVRHLRAATLCTGVLLLDDLFMVHDDLARRYLGFGESVVIVLLAAAVLAYFWRFGQQILAGEWGLMLFALACLFASLLVDQINDRGLLGKSSWRYFAEDAPKFLGIAAWCGYHYRLALSWLVPVSEASRSRAANDSLHPEQVVPRATA